MSKLAIHPTVKKYNRIKVETKYKPKSLAADELKQIILDFGADDVGFVDISDTKINDQRDDILKVFPKAKTLISFVCKMNREPIRTPARSISNIEFHHVGDDVNNIGRKIVKYLEDKQIGAINPAMGFPMEMDNFPGKIWIVSPQTCCGGCRTRKNGNSPKYNSPKIRQFRSTGNHRNGSKDRSLQ